MLLVDDTTAPDALLVFFTLGLLALILYLRSGKRASSSYPPGPRRLPLLGNLLQFPTGGFEWKEYDKMSKKFGTDILYLRAVGMDFIILNSLEAVTDLLDKRSSIYSSRPAFPMANDLIGWDWMYSMVPYGEFWRERRRTFTKYFQTKDSSAFAFNQQQFVRRMLPALLDHPTQFVEIARTAVGGSALSMAYGFTVKKEHDPNIEIAELAMSTYNEAIVANNFLVNIIPALRYVPSFLPGAGFKRKANEWRGYQEQLRNVPFERALRDAVAGTAKPSLLRSFLEDAGSLSTEKHGKQVEIMKDVAGIVFAGSVDTTVAAINTFYAAMLLFPDVQRKAKQELDRVVVGRLPEISDEKEIPYITALVKEIFRWNPLAPLGLPHASTEDDIYRGYFIPKGSIVMANAWSLLQDERHFPDPTIFKPERYLKNGQLNSDVRDSTHIIFGFGRRVCPGSHIALSFLWLAVATILSAFDISNDIDINGNPIEPNIEFHSNLVCEPGPFKCTIKPRSKAIESLIRDVELADSDVA